MLIKISDDLWTELNKEKFPGESFEAVIRRRIDDEKKPRRD